MMAEFTALLWRSSRIGHVDYLLVTELTCSCFERGLRRARQCPLLLYCQVADKCFVPTC